MQYSLSVEPAPSILGTSVTLTLHAHALQDEPDALTFDHQSLTLELTPPDWTREPRVSFPNRRVILEKGILLREGSSGGIEDLKAGEIRSREFALERLFPLEMLRPGQFVASFSLAGELREIRPEPVSFQVLSGPLAVPALLDVLESDDEPRRAPAAALLQRMTLHGFEYQPLADQAARSAAVARWRKWWSSAGETPPWNYQSDRVTFGIEPAAPPPSRLSDQLGGIAFRVTPWSRRDRAAVLEALQTWRGHPVPDSLGGYQRVADLAAVYPPEGSVFEADAAITLALCGALADLQTLIERGEDHAADAAVLLATLAAVPSELFVPALQKLAGLLPQTPPWALARSVCLALFAILQPEPEPEPA